MTSEPLDECGGIQELKRRASITRDVRFQTSRRLSRRNKFSYLVIATHSLLIIILSLLPNIFVFSLAGHQALLALSIINSVFVIITTFSEASENYALRAQQFHKSATKISKICNKISYMLNKNSRIDAQIESDLEKEYHDTLDDYPFTHYKLDYKIATATEPEKTRDYRNLLGIITWIIYWLWEWSWLAIHAIVLLVTLAMLYLIVFDDFFGKTEFVDRTTESYTLGRIIHEPRE